MEETGEWEGSWDIGGKEASTLGEVALEQGMHEATSNNIVNHSTMIKWEK